MGSGLGGRVRKDVHKSVDERSPLCKLVELISVGLNVGCTSLNSGGTRRHTRAALEAGATRDEILFVIKAGALMSIHALATGAPILAEEAKAAGVKPVPRSNAVATPACDAMKAIGQWNAVWDPLVALDPKWFDEFMAAAAGTYKTCPLPPKSLNCLASPAMLPTRTCTHPARTAT